ERVAANAYDRLLDPEVRAFIARTNDWYPPKTLDLPIEEQRKIYGAMCRAFHCGMPGGVSVSDSGIELPGRRLPIRRYRFVAHAAAVILYFHGGGFILGDLESHDDVCAALCAGTGYDVVSVDYRLAPEHPHPAAFDDACATFDWAAKSLKQSLLLCGD